ncbi:GNAT family N-acetyltransferase [Luteimonas deserti]|uniref:GNAT family N-acetyltransferase n=1 Tax=Luteimonas deserti TaxID=2752306 RepID=A0A7Z0QQL1_9GAMM|nr:GNAT family N-acetyltransferase [Luteimonas deserti]NYZ62994.1 GNAT family N-acetyltransferase [Luteimonas deserti]
MRDSDLRVHVVSGDALAPHLDDVARLRMQVFREWPYLYDGDIAYERGYLAGYARSPCSVCILVLDGAQVVGASTGLPLADEDAAFQAPFAARGMDISRVFYFAESVVLPAWRGRGLGHAFFDRREAHARALGGYALTAFAAVDRAQDDPRRPGDARDNARFWRGRGYVRQADLTMRLPWNEIGRGDVAHALTFWTRRLEADTAT